MSHLLGPDQQFRPMNAGDIPTALDLIYHYHADDAEAAEESYHHSTHGHFVLEERGLMMGVTGYRPIAGTDRSYWLSWTYLSPAAPLGSGQRNLLLDLIREELIRVDARKVFAMVSPLVDSPFGSDPEAGGAERDYQRFGFETEVSHADYYAPGEPQTILGLRLQMYQPGPLTEPDRRLPRFVDADEIGETDDAYYLDWLFEEGTDGTESRRRVAGELDHWIDQVRGWEGRAVFVGVPSDASAMIEVMRAQGFSEDGRLLDFYYDGVDEVRLRFNL